MWKTVLKQMVQQIFILSFQKRCIQNLAEHEIKNGQ